LCSPARTLDVVVIDANRRNEAATLFRSRLAKSRTPSSAYLFGGYSNALENVRDLRCLAQDGLLMRCELQPAGTEIKPGVWAGEEVRIHRTARLLAPCFVGARTKVRANAVVTRCSSLEHHAEVDCGTVVEDSSVLPYTYLGTGLDVAHAVVGFQQLAHLKRKTQVEISDPRLVATVSSSAPLRTLQSAAALAGYVPLQFVRGIFKWSRRPERPASGNCPDVLPALQTSALRSSSSRDETQQFSANLAVVRRYGDQ
jgi:carbonic anhydrase/acetyltransferase-like protein (isoleucine patch superfamily)